MLLLQKSYLVPLAPYLNRQSDTHHCVVLTMFTLHSLWPCSHTPPACSIWLTLQLVGLCLPPFVYPTQSLWTSSTFTKSIVCILPSSDPSLPPCVVLTHCLRWTESVKYWPLLCQRLTCLWEVCAGAPLTCHLGFGPYRQQHAHLNHKGQIQWQ